MHEDMRTLLNAYLDGELHGRRLLEMQAHLASCEDCQIELKELRLVSNLLQASSAPETLPAERFVSQLTLSLPRQPQRDRSLRFSTLTVWLAPAVLLGAWFFVKTVFALTNIFTVANITGLLGNADRWLGGWQTSIWFSAAANLSGGQAIRTLPTLSLLNNLSVFGANLVSGFLWQAVIVLFYWAWLFILWLRRGPKPMKMQKAL
jgi:anti-sigma factor RsiW